MKKEYLISLDSSEDNLEDSSDNADCHLNSASTMQAQAHQQANTAVTRAMAVYWSWIASGLLPSAPATTPKTLPPVETPHQEA